MGIGRSIVTRDSGFQIDAGDSKNTIESSTRGARLFDTHHLESNDAVFDITNTSFTMSCWWTKNNPTASVGVMAKWGSPNGFMVFDNNARSVSFVMNGFAAFLTFPTPAVAGKNHMVATYERDANGPGLHQLRLALNGGTFQTLNYNTDISSTGNSFKLGNYDTGGQLAGTIDMAYFYAGRAFTQAEADELWNSGNGITYSDLGGSAEDLTTNLTAAWKLNEVAGDRINEANPGTYDLVKAGTSALDVSFGEGAVTETESFWTNISPVDVERAALVSSSIVDKEWVLDGIESYVFIPNFPAELSNNTAGAIDIWAAITDLSAAKSYLFTAYSDSAAEILGIYIESGLLYIELVDGTDRWRYKSSALLNTIISNGEKFNVVVEQDGVSPKVYINNVAVPLDSVVTTDTTAWFNNIAPNSLLLGAYDSNGTGLQDLLEGTMARVHVYTDNLTADEKSQNYYALKNRFI